jgi:hypothetical protein
MALRVAESLVDRGGIDVCDIGLRYLDWWRGDRRLPGHGGQGVFLEVSLIRICWTVLSKKLRVFFLCEMKMFGLSAQGFLRR